MAEAQDAAPKSATPGGAAPIIMRARGTALAQVGLLQLIYLPLGLTFLWSTALDRFRLPLALPHRAGWIVATQAVSIALLLSLLPGEAWPTPTLFVMAVALSLVFATMDVSLEALIVETIPVDGRAAVTTAKLRGASLGGMLGGGLLTIAHGRLGWQGSLMVLAAINAACLLPIVRYPEPRSSHARPPADAPGGRDRAGSLRDASLWRGRRLRSHVPLARPRARLSVAGWSGGRLSIRALKKRRGASGSSGLGMKAGVGQAGVRG